MKRAAVAFLTSLLASGSLLAQSDPVPPPRLSPALREPARATLPDKPVPGVMLGSLRVVLEETPLAAVRKAADAGVLERSGDASEHLAWLCYTIPGAPAATRIWLLSDSAEGAVFGVAASRLAPGAKPARRCPALPKALRPLRFDRGLALGMSEAELRGRLGEPSQKLDDWWIYHHDSPMNVMVQGEKVEFRVFNTAYLRFKGGVVDAIRTYVNTVY